LNITNRVDVDLKSNTYSRKQALIVKFGAIGDVIMAIPGVHAIELHPLI
jgi:hypothetical protein